MLVAQISDTHILAQGSEHPSAELRADCLRRCIADINEQQPDVVIFTGDTVQHGQPEEYARLHELLGTLREDLDKLGAEDLHQLQRAWELQHRVLASESVTHHTMFRKETRWPGYYYRGDHMKLDDNDWHCFTLSQYHKETGEWEMEKAPVYHIVD